MSISVRQAPFPITRTSSRLTSSFYRRQLQFSPSSHFSLHSRAKSLLPLRNCNYQDGIANQKRHQSTNKVIPPNERIENVIKQAFPEKESKSGLGSRWTGAISVLLAAGILYGAHQLGFIDIKMKSNIKDYSDKSKFVKPRYAGLPEMELALKEIRLAIDEDTISTDSEDLLAHGYSEWSSTNVATLPVAVAYPKSTAEVSTIAKICHKYRVPIVPYSGGSSLEGNISCPYGGVSVDFAFMDQIVKFNEADMDIVVQPSVSWMSLNETLSTLNSNLFFPVDPGPTARIGGMVGTNCSGTNCVRYGPMNKWVLSLTVVLSDGTVIKTRQRPRKSSAGYNLTSLFVGSEGTLGLVTEITLKLAVLPEETSVAVVGFPSIRQAASAAQEVLRRGVDVQAMEIMDEVQMRVVNLGGLTRPRVWKEEPTLFFKFSGTSSSIKENISIVSSICASHQSRKFEFAKGEKERKLLWSARKESLWSMLALRKEGGEVWSTDVAVPISRLAEIVEISKREVGGLGLFASILGHVGDGNFHASILYDGRVKGEREIVERVVKNMVRRAVEMEGTVTGEHGIGMGKKESLLLELGHDTLGVMKSLKLALDPHWIMNPGKVIDFPE